MATFLKICQDVAREAGTVPGAETADLPTTTTNQVGTLRRIVEWVRDAYDDVQSARTRWRWLQARFSQALTQGVAVYSPTALGITEFNNWLQPGEFPDDNERQFTLYETAKGQADQGFLLWLEWDRFYEMTQVGANASTTGKPQYVSIDPNDNLHVWPTPDTTAVVMGGPYYKSNDTFSEDNSKPAFNAKYHRAIRYRALWYLTVFDEAPESQVQRYDILYQRLISEMGRTQLPAMRQTDPIA